MSERRCERQTGLLVRDYSFKALVTGRHVRCATEVLFPDGYVIQFIERMPKGQARRQAAELRNTHPETAGK